MLTRADLAKYPFLNEASDYIKELGISIEDIATPDFSPVLERAEKRLEEALSKGRVSNEFGNENAEILSFPVSNLILSLTGEERAQRRFALAEAKRAYELLRQESPEKLDYIARTTFGWKLKKIDAQPGKIFYDFAVSLADYLRNSVHLKEPRWKLPNRILDHGQVYATREELARLLEEEVRTRIVDRTGKLPGEVPKLLQPIHLIDNLAEGKNVQHMGRFTLASFLVNIGAGEEEIVKTFKPASDFSERMTRYQVEHIAGKRGGRTKYTCPMCTTLKTHGVCYKPDKICETIRNPLSYYKQKARVLTGRGPSREPS